jgi:hypothetical protein
MAIMINNSRVNCAGYEFGLMVDGMVTDTGSYREMEDSLQLAVYDPAKARARIVMRAIYRTEWSEALV